MKSLRNLGERAFREAAERAGARLLPAASATVPGEGRLPATTSVKAWSSAR